MWDSSERKDMGSRCSLCSVIQASSMHHLIPNSIAKMQIVNTIVKRQGLQKGRMTPLCRYCHTFVHKAFTNKQLGTHHNTVQKLKENGLVQQFTEIMRVQGIHLNMKRIQIENEIVVVKPYGFEKPISGMELRRVKQEKNLQELDNLKKGRGELRMVDTFFRNRFHGTWHKSRGLI